MAEAPRSHFGSRRRPRFPQVVGLAVAWQNMKYRALHLLGRGPAYHLAVVQPDGGILQQLGELVADGTLRPHIIDEFSLEVRGSQPFPRARGRVGWRRSMMRNRCYRLT